MKQSTLMQCLLAICILLQAPLSAQPVQLTVEFQSDINKNVVEGLQDLGDFNPGFMDYTDDACMVFRVGQTLVIRNIDAGVSYLLSPSDIGNPDYDLSNYRFVGLFDIAGDPVEELVLAPKFDQKGPVYVCKLGPDNHFTPSFSWGASDPTVVGQRFACANVDGDDAFEILVLSFTPNMGGNGFKGQLTVLGMGHTPGLQNETPTSNLGNTCSLGNFEIQLLLPPNYRWPENRTIMPAGSQDFDGDQVNDYLIITLENCIIVSGDTHNVLYQQDNLPQEALSLNFTKLAYLDVCGAGAKSILFCGSNTGQNLRDMEIIMLIDTSTGEILWTLQPYLDNGFRVVGITKCVSCNNGSLRFILSHQITGRVIVVGPGDGFQAGGGTEWSTPAKERNESYSLYKIWESATAANTYMPLKEAFEGSELDINQDGQPDIVSVVMQDSLSNNSVGITVLDATTSLPIWDTPIPAGGFNDPAPYFHGFFDANGDGEKELFFGAETVQTADGTIHKPFNTGFIMEYIYDLNGDGFEEIIGKSASGKIQVYSNTEGTSAMEEQLHALGKPAIVPNPTTGSILITWNQPETGDLRFELFDERGSLVISNPLETVPAGLATFPIHLSESLPNGLYMARLVSHLGYSPAFIVLQR